MFHTEISNKSQIPTSPETLWPTPKIVLSYSIIFMWYLGDGSYSIMQPNLYSVPSGQNNRNTLQHNATLCKVWPQNAPKLNQHLPGTTSQCMLVTSYIMLLWILNLLLTTTPVYMGAVECVEHTHLLCACAWDGFSNKPESPNCITCCNGSSLMF